LARTVEPLTVTNFGDVLGAVCYEWQSRDPNGGEFATV
jgi:hypothetical protein